MSEPSLRSRIALAIALTVAFYVLALTIALGLIVAPIALWASSGSGNIWITIAMIGAGLSILRAIVPERNRFTAPGPLLQRADHPRLHELLDRVATTAGQPPADRVYLDLEVNASVMEDRRDRVMILGLGLLSTLDAEELEAVVAHEYGHYARGDTRLAQWIWRTRVAILKATQALATSDSWFRRNVVRWPFQGYAILFLRITNAVSRRAEFLADAYAAEATSARAAGRALRRLAAVAPVFDGYWANDVRPMLSADRRPAVAAGFRAMTAHADLATALDEVVADELQSAERDPYSSHPTLRERLTALGVEPEAAAPAPVDSPATELLGDVGAVERELLVGMFGDELAAFPAMEWTAAGEVHLEHQRRHAERFGSAFEGVTVGGAAAAATGDPEPRRRALRGLLGDEGNHHPEAVDALAVDVLAALTVVTLADAGAAVTAPPGEPIRVREGEDVLDPWALLVPVGIGEAEPTTWTEHPIVVRHRELPLAAAVPAAAWAPGAGG